MAAPSLPKWMEQLTEEELTFIKKFLIASGSLKEMAKQYGVTYPTVRLRLDRLIQKIQLSDRSTEKPYVELIKSLAIDGKIDYHTAKILISEYKKEDTSL